jgi:AcrR family transcriptional regulator
MEANEVMTKPETSAARTGRPRREHAGEVEERILDAAGKVFLRRGFEGASIDEIAEVARAGKPTIYARFPGKEALFTAVVARKVRRNTNLESIVPTGATIRERLTVVAMTILHRVLVPETVGLIQSTIAESRRFPELASGVSKMARERGTEAVVAQLLSESAQSDEMRPLAAFAPDQLHDTARRFVDLVLLPMLMRALFGENLEKLQAEIDPHVEKAVPFFLAGCRYD